MTMIETSGFTPGFFQAVAFLFGLVVGSFLNAVVYRLIHGGSIWFGRSACPHCKKTLGFFDLIPVVSFLVLRGKCRYCTKQISLQYPIVELVTASAVLMFWLIYGSTLAWVFSVLYIGFLVVIFVIDLKHQLILDSVTLPALVVAGVGAFVFDLALRDVMIGLAAGFLFFFLQFVLSKGAWIGGGDIRLGAVMGLMLGWQGLLLALVLSYVGGTIVAFGLLASKKRTWKDPIPLGTFLSAATVVVLLYGEEIIQWYLSIYIF